MNTKEEEIEIRKVLRREFPNTAFQVVWDGTDLYIDIIGGELQSMRQLSEEIQERIQNAVFEVVPVLMLFDETEWS